MHRGIGAAASRRRPESVSDRWWRRTARDHVLVALAGLLGAGLALRIYFLLVWSPAITGYSDTGI